MQNAWVFWKKCANITILDNEFLKVTITKWDPKTFLLAWFVKFGSMIEKKKKKKPENPCGQAFFRIFGKFQN
jgi:hypothetical protein